jgi:hypothetical protein
VSSVFLLKLQALLTVLLLNWFGRERRSTLRLDIIFYINTTVWLIFLQISVPKGGNLFKGIAPKLYFQHHVICLLLQCSSRQLLEFKKSFCRLFSNLSGSDIHRCIEWVSKTDSLKLSLIFHNAQPVSSFKFLN